jgi:hypothetical protein
MKEFDGYGTGILFYDDNGNAFTINWLKKLKIIRKSSMILNKCVW